MSMSIAAKATVLASLSYDHKYDTNTIRGCEEATTKLFFDSS